MRKANKGAGRYHVPTREEIESMLQRARSQTPQEIEERLRHNSEGIARAADFNELQLEEVGIEECLPQAFNSDSPKHGPHAPPAPSA